MRTILVTGAGGFVGKVVVAALLDRGWHVKAMLRRPRASAGEIVIADMGDEHALQAALQGVDVVVHLAAAKSDEPESEVVNVAGARHLVAACRQVGCRRIINVSTQSTKLPRKGVYARTKSEADKILHGSGLHVTTLLPSIVYGEEPSGVFGAMLKAVKHLPIVPILGDGHWVSAPVYVGDVAQAIGACIACDETIGKEYDIGGPDLVRFDRLITAVASAIGKRRRLVKIPFRIALAGTRAIKWLWPTAPITVSNVLGSNQTVPIDIGPARRDFGFNPIGLTAGLQRVVQGEAGADGGSRSGDGDMVLAEESRMLATYLLAVDLPQELKDRYAQAIRKLIGSQPGPEVRFVRRHPWTLPCLDAATGLLCPHSDLRRRLFVMTAVLEATPHYASFYLSPTPAPVRLIAGLATQGIRFGINVVAGLPLYFWVRWTE